MSSGVNFTGNILSNICNIPNDIPDQENFAYAETFVFGADLDDAPLEGGFNALAKGITSSHIATRITFTDEAMYNKYIKNTNIPCNRYTKTLKNGKEITVYEVYASYGPATDDPANPGATLDPNYLFNTVNSGLLTPTSANTIYNELLKLKRTASVHAKFPLPGVSFFTRTKINLPPLSIIRYTPETEKPIKEFQTSISTSDAAYRNNPTPENLQIHLNNIGRSFEVLRSEIHPEMTMSQFTHEFNEKYGTIGLPERVKITTQLVSDPKKGHSLELLLAGVNDAYRNLGTKQYNFIVNNCAHFIKNLFVNSTTNTKLRAKFNNDPVLGVSTPVSVINAIVAEQLPKEELKPKSIKKRFLSLSNLLDGSFGNGNELKPRLRKTGSGGVLQTLEINYRTPEEKNLKNLVKKAIKSKQFAIKRTINDSNKTTYVFYNKNQEIARAFYDADSKRNVFELPSPLNLQESDNLIKVIEKNDPDAKIKINTTQEQMQEAQTLQGLLQEHHFNDVEILVQKPMEGPSQREQHP